MWPDGGTFSNPQHSPEGQTVPRLRIPEAMNHERLEWHGKGFCGSSIESQFREYHYPAAGYPHVQMYYRYGGSFEERPVLGPQYIESWEGHRTTELTGRFPLQLISPHPRFSFHTMGDGKDAWAADIEDHRELKDDGWYYWLIRLNPEDAEARGIAEGDLVRAFNDRGSVDPVRARHRQDQAGHRALVRVVRRLLARPASRGTRPTAPVASTS